MSGEFDDAVNLPATELERWLTTDESKSVSQSDGGESVGHRSGRRDPADHQDRDHLLDRGTVAAVSRETLRRIPRDAGVSW